ncbi:MAG: hypothetical protein AAGF44_03125 [Pseudomonadota bacterium]
MRHAVQIGLMLAALGLGEAAAGAWTREEGTGQVIFSTGRRVAPVGALTGRIADEDSNTTQIFVEYGLFNDLTIGATLFAELSSTDLGEGSASAGLFLRQRLWQGERGVVSVQAGYIHPIEDIFPGEFGRNGSASEQEVEVRALYGHSWWGDWGSAFFSGEAGYDWHGDAEADEIRLDATIGWEPYRCCLALMSGFATVPVGGGGSGDASLTIAPSIAYTIWPDIGRNHKKPQGPVRPATIQIGINYDLLNSDDGLGVQLSLWRRF